MSCIETFATLRIFSKTMSPIVIGEQLGLDATEMLPIDQESRYKPRREANYWGLCTKGQVESKDNLLHIAALINELKNKSSQLERLRESGCQIDICNYWVSTGQGGPYLDAATIEALSSLRLDIWWDIYFSEIDET